MALLLALLSLVLIYLIDYEPNPCIIPYNLSWVFAIRKHLRAKDSVNISALFDVLYQYYIVENFACKVRFA